ncbi:MAG: UvrD-helicase domain-containing protein, partial [Eggerthellaceae bacterium]|nr:UvrD-helicase domain-containing protein [Eggerthellaceae bacterium]
MMAYTQDQKRCIEHVDGPLLISAGAGSGKTFTLQQRIAYALAPDDGTEPVAKSVDEILAITFTTKAAQEIKSRVRAVLRSKGLLEEALKVDNAWISTIHSMALRILKEHSLEIGIDPSFVQIDDVMVDELRRQAFSDVIDREGGMFEDLIREYGASEFGRFSVSLATLTFEIMDTANSLTNGIDSFITSPVNSKPPTALARQLLVAYENLLSMNPPAKQKDQAEDAAEKLNAYLLAPSHASAGQQAAFDEQDW